MVCAYLLLAMQDDKLKLDPSSRPITLLPSIFAPKKKSSDETSKVIKIKVSPKLGGLPCL